MQRACVYVCMCVCVYVRMYVCMYICMYCVYLEDGDGREELALEEVEEPRRRDAHLVLSEHFKFSLHTLLTHACRAIGDRVMG